jgi:hypothetical protein
MPKLASFCLLAAGAALLIGGCGSSGPSLPADIPQLTAQNLNAYLVRAQQACTLHDAARLNDMADRYAAAVADLPSTVDPQVLTVLRKGGDSLKSLARTGEGCDFGASGASGFSGAKTTTTTPEVASTPAPAPTPKASKPKPKPKPAKAAKPPKPVKPPKPEPAAQPAPTPASGNPGGGNGDQGNGDQGGGSGGIGVGPAGKSAKGGR